MLAVKVLAVITAPALVGQVSELAGWVALFVLPVLFAVGEGKKAKK